MNGTKALAKLADRLVRVLGREAPLSLRACRKTTPAKLLESLKKGGALPVKSELSDLSPLGIRLAGYVPVLGSNAYEKGEFEIQDEGSQVMALFALWPERFAQILQQERPALAGKTGGKAPGWRPYPPADGD
jgi:16S rRNA C967 or C1407 C5-methylase (RsmB/RsmF family)